MTGRLRVTQCDFWYLFEHVLSMSTTYVIAVSSAKGEKGAALKSSYMAVLKGQLLWIHFSFCSVPHRNEQDPSILHREDNSPLGH